MSVTKLYYVLFICFITVMLTACSASPSVRSDNSSSNVRMPVVAEKSTQKLDACTLLTKADAESFLGESATAPATTRTEAMGNVVTQCRYSATSGNKKVGLLVRQAATSDAATKIFQQARTASKELSGADPQVIEGLGDSAYWTGGNLKQLNVLKGDAWLIITASNGTDPVEASKGVSEIILRRFK